MMKHRWTVLAVFTVILLTVAIFSFTTTPIYRGTVRLVIEKEEKGTGGGRPWTSRHNNDEVRSTHVHCGRDGEKYLAGVEYRLPGRADLY